VTIQHLALAARSSAAKPKVKIVFVSLCMFMYACVYVGRPKGGLRGSSKAHSNQEEAMQPAGPRKKAPANQKVAISARSYCKKSI
jgi:hypothetical protein